jgi:hypothetical protein
MNEDIRIDKLPPVWVIRGISTFRSMLLQLYRKTFPPTIVLYENFQIFWLLPCIRVAAELNIAGLLKDGPKSIDELAFSTNTHRESLYRVMRALACQGIFRERKGKIFINTSLSKPMMEGKGSLRNMIMQHLGNLNWSVFNELSYSVKTGEDAFTKVFGKHIYEYLAENQVESDLFEKSMTNLTELAIEPLLSVYDFSGYQTIADIGGGEGFLLANILYKYKKVKGLLFDLAEGVKNAPSIFERFYVSDRVKIVSGDFMKSAPGGADAYMLKNIIHNWSDDQCLLILSNIREVLPPQGKILVIEMMIHEDNKSSFGKLIDIQMLVFMRSGKERTLNEFKDLFSKAGLKINRVVPTIAPFSLIEIIKN